MSGINLYEKELFFYKWYERKYYFYIKYGEIFIMANSDELITSVGKNSNDTAALVWSVADDLVGAYKPHEYGLVILPMTVIKRFMIVCYQHIRQFLIHIKKWKNWL